MIKRILVALVLVLVACAPSFAQGIIDEAAMTQPMGAGNEMPLQRQNKYLNSYQKLFEKSAVTENISHFDYSPNKIVKVRLRENMQTILVFPESESIEGFSLGDPINFKFMHRKPGSSRANIAMVKAAMPGSDTNLTAFGTSGNLYSFYLRNYSTKAKTVHPDFRVHVHDASVKERVLAMKKAAEEAEEEECLDCNRRDLPRDQAKQLEGEYLRSLPVEVDINKIDMGYATSKGDASLAPIKIFSDGYWTFFQYDHDNFDEMAGVPVIYRVIDGYDTLVNTRYQSGTVIAEAINDKWTIRRGDSFLCVRKLER